MGKLLICTALLMLMSGTRSMAEEVTVVPVLRANTKMVLDGEYLTPYKEYQESPKWAYRADAYIYDAKGKVTNKCTRMVQFPKTPSLLLYTIGVTKLSIEHCTIHIDQILKGSLKAKQLKN